MARERRGVRGARLDAHHNTYEHYGDEGVSDLLVALCASCPRLFHGTVEDAS